MLQATSQGTWRTLHDQCAQGRSSRGAQEARRRHSAVVVAVSPQAYTSAYQRLRRGGKLVFVGLPADNTLQIPIFETVLNGISIAGSVVGTRVDLAETFELQASGMTKVIYEKRKLEQVNEAFKEVEDGRVRARLVFGMN